MKTQLVGLLLAGAAVLARAGASESTFTVRYRSAANAYLDGGRAHGLSVGDYLAVRAGGQPVAELEVVFLSEQSASCRIVSEKRPVQAGDVAVPSRSPARASAPAASRAPVSAVAPSPPPAAPLPVMSKPAGIAAASVPVPWARMRGTASLGYHRAYDGSGAGLGFEQRTARLDVSLRDIAARPLSFDARLRSRRDARERPLGTTDLDRRSDRVYELALRYEPPSDRFSLEAGRISGSRYTSVGYLDGALAQVRIAPRLHLGGFFGQRAEFEELRSPGAGRKYGALLRLAPPGRYGGSYEVLLAGTRELNGSDVSREYLSLDSRFGGGHLSLYQRAEVDVNRGWRQALAGRRYQLSNLAASANLRFGAGGSFVVSYDSRQPYRDHRNRSVPEAIFDDLVRRGLRGNLYLGIGRGLNFAVHGGTRFGEAAGGSRPWFYGGSVRHGNLWSSGVSAGADASAFVNGYTDGYLASAHAGRSFAGGHYLDLTYGISSYRVLADGSRRDGRWLRSSMRIQLGWGVYVLGDFEHGMGDDFQGPRFLLETGYQF